MSPRIRVDTTILRQSSNSVSNVGTNLSQVGQSALGRTNGAPGYDGQFGPRVQAIGYEAQSRAQGLSGQMNGLAGQLQSRAQAFEAADFAGMSAFMSTNFACYDPNDPLIFQRIPSSSLDSYLRLAALTSPELSRTPKLFTGGLVFGKQADWNNAQLLGRYRKLPLFGETRGRPYKKEKEKLELNFPVWEGRVWQTGNDPVRLGGVPINMTVGGLAAGLGIGLDSKGKAFIGANLDGAILDVDTHGTLLGDKNLGLGGGVGFQAGHGEAFAGYKDGSVGAEIGVDLVKAEGNLGMNLAGYNVGVTGGIGLGFKLGFRIGKDTKIALGPFEAGFHIGEAL